MSTTTESDTNVPNSKYKEVSRACRDTQRDVTQAFLNMEYPPQTGGEIYSSNNFKAYQYDDGSGRVRHYRTTETIRTRNGLIITNLQCYSAGFAHCSQPRGSQRDGTLPLSLIRRLLPSEFDQYDIRSVNDGLVELPDGYQIYVGEDETSNEDMRFGFLIDPDERVESAEEAEALLRPDVSSRAKRQGEWFLDPVDESEVPELPTRKCLPKAERKRKWWFERCDQNLVVGADHRVDGLQKECRECAESNWSVQANVPTARCKECHAKYLLEELTDSMIEEMYGDRYQEALDALDSHTPRDLIVDRAGNIYVRGTFRHTRNEHRMLNLGEQWYQAKTHDRDVRTVELSPGGSRVGRD